MAVACLSALIAAHAAEPPTKYAMVRIMDYDRSVTNLVMSAAEYNDLQQDIRREAPLVPRALQAAAAEWRDAEAPDGYTGATEHKKGPPAHRPSFPSASLGSRQATVVGKIYEDRTRAEAELAALTASAGAMNATRPSDAGGYGNSRLTSRALDMFVSHLNDLKADLPDVVKPPSSSQKIALKPGDVMSRITSGSTQTPYYIAVPDNFDPATPPPLLVVFSPGGDGRGMMNQVRASANKVGWMVIGCDRLKNGMKDEETAPIEQDLMNDLRTYIPYNSRRLYYGGFSGGAARAYSLTCQFKDPCAGILAFGGWLGGGENLNKPYPKRMVIAMVNGDKDQGAMSWESKDKDALEKRKCTVRAFHFPGGHGVPSREVIDEAITWMDAQAASQKSPAASASGIRGAAARAL